MDATLNLFPLAAASPDGQPRNIGRPYPTVCERVAILSSEEWFVD